LIKGQLAVIAIRRTGIGSVTFEPRQRKTRRPRGVICGPVSFQQVESRRDMSPKVSVVIPTYNRADFLPQAVRSVLSQTFSDYELLILDDASTDRTQELRSGFLEDSRVRYVKHPKNIGITANRNYGLAIARGEYIAMLDSDDVWLDGSKLKRQVDILDNHEDCALVGTYARIIDKNGAAKGEIATHRNDTSIRRNFLVTNQFVQSSVLIRKQVLEELGGYDTDFPLWEDYDLWLRIGRKYLVRNIGEMLTGYRDHDANISKTSELKSLLSYRMIYQQHGKAYPFGFVLLLKVFVKTALAWLKRRTSAARLASS
jgi:glycosyltransferase involved in cell wall biosynthesis